MANLINNYLLFRFSAFIIFAIGAIITKYPASQFLHDSITVPF